jgi:3-oxoacyl-[acyl-carrier protein] reductase
MPARPLSGRTALVTGGNHGIGAATAHALGRLGADVAVTYRRPDAAEGDDPGRPPAYARDRRQTTAALEAALDGAGVRWISVEADLTDPDTPARLVDRAETELGPVSILVNNASGWRKDTFVPGGRDRSGRVGERVSAETFDAQPRPSPRGRAGRGRARHRLVVHRCRRTGDRQRRPPAVTASPARPATARCRDRAGSR